MRKPRLFYWNDGFDSWILINETYTVYDFICNVTDMNNDEIVNIKFKRIDLNENEILVLNIPE